MLLCQKSSNLHQVHLVSLIEFRINVFVKMFFFSPLGAGRDNAAAHAI